MFGLINVSYICITCNVNDIWLLTMSFLKSISGLLAMSPTFALLTASNICIASNVAVFITYHVITCIAYRSSFALLTRSLLALLSGHHMHYLPCHYCITYHVITCIVCTSYVLFTMSLFALLTGHHLHDCHDLLTSDHLHYLPYYPLDYLYVIICFTYHVITSSIYSTSSFA